MNKAGLLEREELKLECHGSLDHAGAIEQMRAIDLAMQRYFESRNWIVARNKELPGLQRRLGHSELNWRN